MSRLVRGGSVSAGPGTLVMCATPDDWGCASGVVQEGWWARFWLVTPAERSSQRPGPPGAGGRVTCMRAVGPGQV